MSSEPAAFKKRKQFFFYQRKIKLLSNTESIFCFLTCLEFFFFVNSKINVTYILIVIVDYLYSISPLHVLHVSRFSWFLQESNKMYSTTIGDTWSSFVGNKNFFFLMIIYSFSPLCGKNIEPCGYVFGHRICISTSQSFSTKRRKWEYFWSSRWWWYIYRLHFNIKGFLFLPFEFYFQPIPVDSFCIRFLLLTLFWKTINLFTVSWSNFEQSFSFFCSSILSFLNAMNHCSSFVFDEKKNSIFHEVIEFYPILFFWLTPTQTTQTLHQ